MKDKMIEIKHRDNYSYFKKFQEKIRFLRELLENRIIFFLTNRISTLKRRDGGRGRVSAPNPDQQTRH